MQGVSLSQYAGVAGGITLLCVGFCTLTHAVSSATPGENTLQYVLYSSWVYCLTGAAWFILFVLVVCSMLGPETWIWMAYCNAGAWMHTYLFYSYSALCLFSLATSRTSAYALICPHLVFPCRPLSESGPWQHRGTSSAQFSCMTFLSNYFTAFAAKEVHFHESLWENKPTSHLIYEHN